MNSNKCQDRCYYKPSIQTETEIETIGLMDGFCGGGGTTEGWEKANHTSGAKIEVVACINHDANAIRSHAANHPNCVHLTEDIKFVNVAQVKELFDNGKYSKRMAWFSLECTNNSNAKGGVSRDPDSRTLAAYVFRYFRINFDKVYIENVREFMDWGPLTQKIKNGKPVFDKKGKPVMLPDKKRKGEFFRSWIKRVEKCGYHTEFKILNCADYGCPTSRKRLFIQFSKIKEEIRWPKPTHAGNHLPVRPYLNLNNHGQSIFTGKKWRKKNPADNTLKRIKRGAIKHRGEEFMHTAYSKGENVYPLSRPCPTLTCRPKGYLTFPYLTKYYGRGNNTLSINETCPTLTTKDRVYLQTVFLMDFSYNNTGRSIDKPCPTLIAQQGKKPMYFFAIAHGLKDIGHLLINVRDSYYMRDLKRFCLENGIQDIYMRPLELDEMLRISTFPEDYELIGTLTECKKFVGNAVPPNMAMHLAQVA